MRRSWLTLALILAGARPAAATYSIVGADTATQEIGGSGTSCVDGADVYIIYGSAPGYGVIHAQALANEDGRDYAVELFEQGLSPQEIIEELTSPDYDFLADSRQYGIADVMGRTAGFTGENAQSYAADVQGQIGSFSYSIQGNILTSDAVLTQAVEAFEGPGCDLAERLMLALEAGADNGEGDSRCTDDGRPSDSAYLQVDRPDGEYVSLRVPSSDDNPLVELRAEYDEWRATNPCPDEPDPGAGGAGGMTGGAGGAGGTSAAGTGGGGGASSGGRGGGAGQANAGSAPIGGAGGGSDAPEASSAEDGGCACRAVPRRSSAPAGLLLAALVALGGARSRKLRRSLASRRF